MLMPTSQLYQDLLAEIRKLPVIDCHEHLMGPQDRPKYQEPIASLVLGYVQHDLESAAFGIPAKDFQKLADEKITTDEKWPLFQELWGRTQHTAYARVTWRVLKDFYGEDQMTRLALERVAGKLASMDEAAYFRILEQANIQAMVVDVIGWLPGGLGTFLNGQKTFPEKWRLAISLPEFHSIRLAWNTIQMVGGLVDRHITCLDEYLEAVFTVFQRCVEKGVVAIKDQSAYERIISYDLPAKSDAEKQFNQLLMDPRGDLGWPNGKPLNDYLFHQFMRFARELKLPVQLHTGHMAGTYNRVDKTNAGYLANVLELHREVQFDLFHGNWPYLGDLLFLGKNYPNASLNLCWLHIIDPVYAIELMQRAVQTMPHSKVHGFGGDYGDAPEYIAGHLKIAQENIAAALALLVESGWLREEQALPIARDWLFNNPNRFFKLGLTEI